MADTPMRDVTNHVLFEVATEVANRGAIHISRKMSLQLTNSQSEVSTQSLNPKHRSPRPSMELHTPCLDRGIEHP